MSRLIVNDCGIMGFSVLRSFVVGSLGGAAAAYKSSGSFIDTFMSLISLGVVRVSWEESSRNFCVCFMFCSTSCWW